MKIAIDVKNMKKAIRPSSGDVIMFNGNDWYITTKEDLFKEYQEKVDAKLSEVENELLELRRFKTEVSSQLIEMSEVIKSFVKLQGE